MMSNVTLKDGLLFIALYITVMTIFSLKTIYYYQGNALWYVYAFCISVLFVWFVFHCINGRPYTNIFLVGMTLFISLSPIEIEFVRIYEATFGEGIELSGLAKLLPNATASLLLELWFYPLLILSILVITKFTFSKKVS